MRTLNARGRLALSHWIGERFLNYGIPLNAKWRISSQRAGTAVKNGYGELALPMPNRGFVPDEILFDAVWTLSGNGQTAGQYLHRWTEPCAHTADQTADVIRRLKNMPPPERAELYNKIRKVKDARRRLWGAEGRCELCRILVGIAENRLKNYDFK